MLYLLDANVPITAHNNYYPIDQVPEFWAWLRYQGDIGNVKIPVEIFDEIKYAHGKDNQLFQWINSTENKNALLLNDNAVGTNMQYVLDNGYANDLTDDEIESLGRDPFLMTYALGRNDRCVVTTEASKPSKTRQNRKIPDVCSSLSIQCYGPFYMNRTLGFSTDWDRV